MSQVIDQNIDKILVAKRSSLRVCTVNIAAGATATAAGVIMGDPLLASYGSVYTMIYGKFFADIKREICATKNLETRLADAEKSLRAALKVQLQKTESRHQI